ncbi:uncharacterized protein LOC123352251 isoform X2 [Mauremys mutica]|uniref:uncharacterized protein LOC123352251 isoform X2 n=1 Tax=Mauremys mutica TaxID=74926 RepID=UPI001D16A259|nr:uncharacterized protein LOC123352251 isoform X2 [Mauremys mutica]
MLDSSRIIITAVVVGRGCPDSRQNLPVCIAPGRLSRHPVAYLVRGTGSRPVHQHRLLSTRAWWQVRQLLGEVRPGRLGQLLQMGKLRHRGGHAASEVHRGYVAEQGFEPRPPESQPLITRHRSLPPGTATKTFLIHWLHFLILFIGKVQSAPDVVAHFGEDVTLSCLFPSQPGMNLQRLTLTWQKERAGAEDLVVHSYYYGREQLKKQDKAYRNRIRLDPEWLAWGDASLTLRGVRTQDEGVYLCHVTSELGKTSERRELRVGGLLGPPASCLGVRLAVICAACLFIVLLAAAFLYCLRQAPAGSRSRRKAEEEEEQKEISCPIPASPTGHEQPARDKS